MIESNRKLLELSEEILDRLKEKLERLYDIGNSTRFLFDNASDWLSAVSSAIEDLQVTITGEGNLSDGSWKGLLIPSFEEKVGRLENFKGGNEWNTFTIKEKINKLKDMIEETTETLPRERREWIENEIRKIIPNLTPEEREAFKTAMKEHGLKYDEIGLAWNELTTEGRFRRLKRMIEKTTESMPKVRKERIEGKIKELIPYLSTQEKQELKTAMKEHGLEYDESGSEIDKYIENLKNNNLNLSEEKMLTIYVMAETLLKEGFEPAFVAGVLGNVTAEGNIGLFESSSYISKPSEKPEYLKHMDKEHNYNAEFSGKNISEVGIAKTFKLITKLDEDGCQGKFGLGCIQWTESRTMDLIDYYTEICGEYGYPTTAQCIQAESQLIVQELKSGYKEVYQNWCDSSSNLNASESADLAGKIVCKEYEKPMHDSSKERGAMAAEIYEVMMGE